MSCLFGFCLYMELNYSSSIPSLLCSVFFILATDLLGELLKGQERQQDAFVFVISNIIFSIGLTLNE